MSKLEYMIAIAYHLGKMDKDKLDFDIDFIDIEVLTTICGVILDDFYEQREVAYIAEFLNDLDPQALNEIYQRLV